MSDTDKKSDQKGPKPGIGINESTEPKEPVEPFPTTLEFRQTPLVDAEGEPKNTLGKNPSPGYLKKIQRDTGDDGGES